MLAAAKNYDVICLQMRSYLPHLDDPIKRETMAFLNRVKTALQSEQSIKTTLDSFIPHIFNFRIKALKWLGEESDIDLHKIIDDAYPVIEQLGSNAQLTLLAENILFAMRCNRRVVNAVYSSGSINVSDVTKYFSKAPAISYEQFLGTLAFSIPDEYTVQRLADWVNASLYIEFIVVAAIIINEDNIAVSDAAVNEMAFLIANASQEYVAVAAEMGLLKSSSYKVSTEGMADKNSINEQSYLADLGLADFAENF